MAFGAGNCCENSLIHSVTHIAMSPIVTTDKIKPAGPATSSASVQSIRRFQRRTVQHEKDTPPLLVKTPPPMMALITINCTSEQRQTLF